MTSDDPGRRLFAYNDADGKTTQKKEFPLPRRTIYYLKEEAFYA
jgi:hypothetical protein